jgi:hypothetical protein
MSQNYCHWLQYFGLHPLLKGLLYSRKSRVGQGGLIAIAVTVVVTLVLVSGAMSGMSALNASRTVVTKQTLQSYYIAQSGIQEALATRMVPRSNLLNFSASAAAAQTPVYAGSGLVYRNPDPTNPSGLLGQYRYLVVGGQGARVPNDGSYYNPTVLNNVNIPRLLVTDTIPDTSPFIIISNASVCKSTTNRSAVVPDMLIPGTVPSCKAGYAIDELTLIAQARLNREKNGTLTQMDRATQMRVFKNSNNLTLPAGAQVPGYTNWQPAGSTINFTTAWNGGSVELARVVFYNFADNTVYANVPIAGANTSVATSVPAKSVIRLYFNNAFDFRSISPSYNSNLTDCTAPATAATCRIRVMQNTNSAGNNGTAYVGNTTIPLLPDGSQVILLPPLTNQLVGNQYNAIKVDANLMRTSGAKTGAQSYTVVFQTQ